jgi:hypothetical protein
VIRWGKARLGTLLDLINEGETLAKLLRTSRDARAAKAQYGAWRKSVLEHLKDDPLAHARFCNARPVAHAHAGMAFRLVPYWQTVEGKLPVLIEIAKEEREGAKQEEIFALNPRVWGVGVNLKAAGRKLKNIWRRRIQRNGQNDEGR